MAAHAGQQPSRHVTASSTIWELQEALRDWGLPFTGKTKAERWERLQEQVRQPAVCHIQCNGWANGVDICRPWQGFLQRLPLLLNRAVCVCVDAG